LFIVYGEVPQFAFCCPSYHFFKCIAWRQRSQTFRIFSFQFIKQCRSSYVRLFCKASTKCNSLIVNVTLTHTHGIYNSVHLYLRTTWHYNAVLLGEIALAAQVTDSAYSCTLLDSKVCLSSVYRISALCLNHSMDLDAIWLVHLWGPITQCVRWGSLTPRGKARLEVKPPVKTCTFKIAHKPSVLCCHMVNTNEKLARLAIMILHFAKVLWCLLSLLLLKTSAHDYSLCATSLHYAELSLGSCGKCYHDCLKTQSGSK